MRIIPAARGPSAFLQFCLQPSSEFDLPSYDSLGFDDEEVVEDANEQQERLDAEMAQRLMEEEQRPAGRPKVWKCPKLEIDLSILHCIPCSKLGMRIRMLWVSFLTTLLHAFTSVLFLSLSLSLSLFLLTSLPCLSCSLGCSCRSLLAGCNRNWKVERVKPDIMLLTW